jgi:hypothetical protein
MSAIFGVFSWSAAIAEDKAFYSANGYVHIRNVFNSSEAALLSRWVEEIGAWPQSNESKWMHHYEHTVHGARLTRTENIVSYLPQLGRWLMAGKLPSLVGQLLGDDVFLYKEKINYKIQAVLATQRIRTRRHTSSLADT